jgi:outer membrane protein TolC
VTRAAGLTIIALLLLTPPADAQVPTALSLREAIARALEANRTLLASRRARAVGLAERDVAGQRPNPEVSVEAEKETPHWAFAGTLPLELYGKRQRRIDVAQASLAVSDAEIARTTSDVLSDVRRAYY